LTSCRYGNVMNSTGSLIPLIKESIQNQKKMILYSDQMTRFMIDKEEAVNLILHSLKYSGVVIIPKIKSFLIKDMFELYSEHSGLQYIIGSPRTGEKIHEIMIGSEELNRAYDKNNFIHISPDKQQKKQLYTHPYTSSQSPITKNELLKYLQEKKLI